MSERLQFLTQLDKVVDGAVEDDYVAPISCNHRLACRFRKIEDRKPPESYGHSVLAKLAAGVWTAMGDQVRHAVRQFEIRGAAVRRQDHHKTAHLVFSVFRQGAMDCAFFSF